MDNEKRTSTDSRIRDSILAEMGTFGGFNFQSHAPIRRGMTAAEVLGWDEASQGKAWFWPTGNHLGLHLLFGTRARIDGADLLHLVDLLEKLGNHGPETYVRIYHALTNDQLPFGLITPDRIPAREVHIFDRSTGTTAAELRTEAASEIVRQRHPEAYRFWRENNQTGFTFDPDAFLNPNDWNVKEIETDFRRRVLILIARHG